jgi:hypothetical protein
VPAPACLMLCNGPLSWVLGRTECLELLHAPGPSLSGDSSQPQQQRQLVLGAPRKHSVLPHKLPQSATSQVATECRVTASALRVGLAFHPARPTMLRHLSREDRVWTFKRNKPSAPPLFLRHSEWKRMHLFV